MGSSFRNFSEFITQTNQLEAAHFKTLFPDPTTIKSDPPKSVPSSSDSTPVLELVPINQTCNGLNFWECERCFTYRGFHADGQHYHKRNPIMVKTMISHNSKLIRSKRHLLRAGQLKQQHHSEPLTDLLVGEPFAILYSFYLGLLPKLNPLVAEYHFNQIYSGYVCGNQGKLLGTHLGTPLRAILEQSDQDPVPTEGPNPINLLLQLSIVCAELAKHGVVITHPQIKDLLLYENNIAYRYGANQVETNEGLILGHTAIPCFNLDSTRFMINVELPKTSTIEYYMRYYEASDPINLTQADSSRPIQTLLIKQPSDLAGMIMAGLPVHPCLNFYVYFTWLFSYRIWRRDVANSKLLRSLIQAIWSPSDYDLIVQRLIRDPPSTSVDIYHVLKGIYLRCDVIELVLAHLATATGSTGK